MKAEIIIRDRYNIILSSILEIEQDNNEIDRAMVKYRKNTNMSASMLSRRLDDCRRTKEYNNARKLTLLAQADVLKWALGDFD